ncbi:hypothetical protein SUGI_1085890 [Cryptomeria japonica]|nr:hypothetical protein SUGI_1085890 [Cryptomeria japonica]
MECLLQTQKLCTIMFVCMLLLPVAHSLVASSIKDQEALLQFRHSISYDPFDALANWNSSISLCNWTGVACSLSNERFIELNLTGIGLRGTMSPFMGNLSFSSAAHSYK